MRELSQQEQHALGALIGDWHLAAALVTIVDWGCSLDDTLPLGQSHRRLESWNHRLAADPPPAAPEPDDLRDFAACAEAWGSASVLDLLHAIETMLDADWWASRATCRRIASAGGAKYWIVRKHASKPTRADRMPHGWGGALKHFHVVPNRLAQQEVELVETDRHHDDLLAAARAVPTAYLVHFEPSLLLDLQERGDAIQVMAIKNAPAHAASVLGHLAVASRCTFMVIPECTMPLTQRRALARAIGAAGAQAPLLTLAGSFHDPQAQSPHARCLNTADLLDHRGNCLLSHVKTASAALRTLDGRDVAEYIETHNTVRALVTSLGLVGVAICVEFSHPDGRSHAAWSDIAPEWMLVASMGEGNTLDLHRDVAKQLLGTHRTATMVANQSARGGQCPGFVLDGTKRRAPLVNRPLKLKPKAP